MPHTTKQLADLIVRREETPVILFGTVTSYTAATSTAAQVLTCDFEGQGKETTCITIDSYTDGSPGPAVGDYVVAISIGPDHLVIGRLS